MIRYHNREIESLDQVLMPCHCRRGELTWDEKRRAWRCTACPYGLTIEGFFDCEDLDFQLSHGCDVRTLPLSRLVLVLIETGALSLSWVTGYEAATRRVSLEAAVREEPEIESREELQRLMREMPRRSR